ncbi:MAG TPA: hypothetical protein VLA82_13995 [Actinomycetota bacterium]|nr:hypothetical protein [Actinomycetota bacterium]
MHRKSTSSFRDAGGVLSGVPVGLGSTSGVETDSGRREGEEEDVADRARTSAEPPTSWTVARVAGGLAVAVAIVVAVSLPLRDVDFNAANLWTLLLGAAGGLLAFLARSKGSLAGATVAITLAALPALVGWVGWLFLPSLVILILSLARSEE